MDKEYMMQRLEIGQPEYDREFWDVMRGGRYSDTQMNKGLVRGLDTFLLPQSANNKLMKALEKQSRFRRTATFLKAYNGYHKIKAKDCDDVAVWVKEGDRIPVYDTVDDFTDYDIGFHRLVCIARVDEDVINDATFDFEDYLIDRFARVFGRAEEQAFVNGTGVNQPTGIICPNKGAEVSVTVDALSADSLIQLYFSLKPEYRANAIWMMNDETALAIRSMKDADGNYIWDGSESSLLGRPVVISNYMPSAKSGSMPIVFGDFSYYWVVGRKPLSVRALQEKFALYNQIGYLGVEFLDGKLIRREAMKAVQITPTV